MASFGVTEAEFTMMKLTPSILRLLEHEVEKTWKLFEEGRRLEPLVNAELAKYVKVIIECGEEVLTQIKKHRFDVFSNTISMSGIAKAIIGIKLLFNLM
jgi:phytoene/squalene synthetase